MEIMLQEKMALLLSKFTKGFKQDFNYVNRLVREKTEKTRKTIKKVVPQAAGQPGQQGQAQDYLALATELGKDLDELEEYYQALGSLIDIGVTLGECLEVIVEG